MPRLTIVDVARTANLSTATVDRALNGRPGVSAANRHRVMEAARVLGYLPTEGRVALPARPAHLQFYMPFGNNSFMRSLANSITDVAARLPLVASCTIVGLDGIGPEALLHAVERIDPRTSGVGIITTDHPQSRRLINQIAEAGVRVVTIVSDVPDTARSAYVGVDNRVAGRVAGQLMGRMLPEGRGNIAVFMGSHAFLGHRERMAGFSERIASRFPGLTLLPALETDEDNGRSFPLAQRLLRGPAPIAGIYCVGAGRSGIAEALRLQPREGRPLVIMHDLTDDTQHWLEEELVDVVIDQNTRILGEQAVIRLLGSIAMNAPFPTLKYIEPRIVLSENIPA
jgi:LacI family transcriptional regulator